MYKCLHSVIENIFTVKVNKLNSPDLPKKQKLSLANRFICINAEKLDH